jgi:hypothetical protein
MLEAVKREYRDYTERVQRGWREGREKVGRVGRVERVEIRENRERGVVQAFCHTLHLVLVLPGHTIPIVTLCYVMLSEAIK